MSLPSSPTITRDPTTRASSAPSVRRTRRTARLRRARFLPMNFCSRARLFKGDSGYRMAWTSIRNLLADGAEVRLGRSRGAQYGGSGKWEWLAAMPQAEPAEPARCVVVTLLTPLVNVNQFGHPAPEFPIAEIGAALGDASARVEQQFVRVEWVAGYLSHQGLPRHQMPALAAGSVFVLTLANPGQFADAGRRCWLGNNPSQIPISGKLCQTLSEIRISVLPSCPCPTSASAPGDPCPGGRKCSKHSAIPDPSWKWQDAASSARGLTEGPASPFRAQPCPACGVPVTLLAAFCTRCDEPILR